MKRWFLPLLALLFMATPVSAHFLWVVPDITANTARLIISETLSIDQRVDIGIVSGATLSWRGPDGRDVPLTLTRTGQVFTIGLKGPRGTVHGYADLGVRPSGERAYRLHYYPKTVVGSPYDVALGKGRSPIEIVVVGMPGATRLKVLVGGKPASGVDVNVVAPDGTDDTLQTNAQGLTDTLTGHGRYGAWTRYFEPIGGTLNGTRFDQTRHYTMLVFDTDAGGAAPAATPTASTAVTVATIPEAASSFGAVASNGWLYVYGGHVVPTHQYSTAAVSGRFNRLKLSDLSTWEALPGGPSLQGMNLAAFDGKIYRAGGMQPRNAPGEQADLVSVADVARFDPALGNWEALPPLPAPLSSHDVAVIGQQLFVVGGWNLRGDAEEAVWSHTMAVLDLSAPTLQWRTLPQPFARRAFIVAALDDKMFVLGGFDEQSHVLRGTSIYDAARGTWSEGPALPGGMLNGFGPAAAVVNGRLFISVDNGGVYRLNVMATGWDEVGRATPRIVHRLAPVGGDVLVIGGAGDDDNSNLIERLRLP